MTSGEKRGPELPGRGVVRLYTIALRFYAPTFRREYGDKLDQIFRERFRTAAAFCSRWVPARFVAAALGGAFIHGTATRWAALRGHRFSRSDAEVYPPSTKRSLSPGIAMTNFTQDLRFALRSLAKRPGFVAVVIFTLALGIGANTVVFTVLDGVLLSPLPYEEPERLVRLYQGYFSRPEELNFLAGAGFLAYREQSDIFAGVGAYYTYRESGTDLTGGDEPERVVIMEISADAFAVLGAEPMMGREFTRAEERRDAGVAMISYGLWQRYFGGDPEILGTSFLLAGAPHVVVGVMPAGFRNPIGGQPEIWVPEHLHPVAEGYDPNNWDNHYLSAVARLQPGVTIAQALARLDALVPGFIEEDPDAEGQTARLVPLLEDKVGHTRTMLVVLMGAVGMVLLIACVNVANLFLARTSDRWKELALRAALGAGRVRLVTQMIAESLLLGLAGGVAGLLLAVGGLRTVLALAPDTLPRVASIGIDLRVFGFTLLVAVATGLLFGIAPALQFSRPSLERALREEDRGHSGGNATRRLRAGLVVAEVSVALVLLVGAGLLLKSFAALVSVDLGVRTESILTYEVHLPDARYDAAQRVTFYDAFFERVEAIPGVLAVGATSYLPSEGEYHQWGMRRRDIDADSEAAFIGPNVRVIDHDYLRVMGIGLVSGRAFGPTVVLGSPRVLLINQYLAEHLFPDRDPVGAPVRLAGYEYEVAGIITDTAFDPKGTVGPKVYLSHDQYADNRNWAMIQTVRTDGEPTTIVAQLRAELREVDPNLVLYRVRTMEDVVGAGISPQRFSMALMGAFAAVALLLAAVGIYGVLAYTVAQRTHEIGIRMALGADRSAVRGLVLRHGLVLTAVGILIGIAGSLALTRWLSSLLFGVEPNDPLVFGAVAIGLALVAALAGWLPARRATSVDPLLALRRD